MTVALQLSAGTFKGRSLSERRKNRESPFRQEYFDDRATTFLVASRRLGVPVSDFFVLAIVLCR